MASFLAKLQRGIGGGFGGGLGGYGMDGALVSMGAPSFEISSAPGATEMTGEMVALQRAMGAAEQARFMGLGDYSTGGIIQRDGPGTSVSGAKAAGGDESLKVGAARLQGRDAYSTSGKGWVDADTTGNKAQLTALVGAVKAIYDAVGADKLAPVTEVQKALDALKEVDKECKEISKEDDQKTCKADVAAVREYIDRVKAKLEGAGQKFA